MTSDFDENISLIEKAHSVKQSSAYKMFKKLHEKIFISIQFNKAYFLYVLKCENGMFQKLYKGMQAN